MTYRPEWMDAGSDDGTSHRQSLARSTSEFTEEWPQRRLPYDRVSSTDGSEDYSEPRRSNRPTLERSTTEVEEAVPQADKRQSTSSSSSAGSGDFNRRVPYERVPSSSGSEEGSSSRRRHQ